MANTKKNIAPAEDKAAENNLTQEKTETVKNDEAIKSVENTEPVEKEISVKTPTENEEVSDSISELASAINSFATGGDLGNAASRSKTIPLEKEIGVMSVTFGGLTWISEKTKSHYRWNAIGDVEYIPFNELISMHSTARDFMFEPYVIILDSDVANYFRLNNVYKEFAYVNKLEELFNECDFGKIEEALNKIKRTNMRNVAISKIRALKNEGKLNDYRVIRLVKQILCFDLDDLG